MATGPAKRFYRGGQLEFEGEYKKGRSHGQRIVYNKNGKRQNGLHELFYENDSLQAVGTAIDGLLEGKYTWFYQNGMVSSKLYYRKGKADGNLVYFYENGKTKRIEFHNDGNFISEVKF